MSGELELCFYIFSSILLLVSSENTKNAFCAKCVDRTEYPGINFIPMMQPVLEKFLDRTFPAPFRKPAGKFFLEIRLTEDTFWKRFIKERLHIRKGNAKFFRVGVAKTPSPKHHAVKIIRNRFNHIFSNIILRTYTSTITEIGKWSEP